MLHARFPATVQEVLRCLIAYSSRSLVRYPGLQEVRDVPGQDGIAFVEFGDDMQATVRVLVLDRFAVTFHCRGTNVDERRYRALTSSHTCAARADCYERPAGLQGVPGTPAQN